MPTQEQMADKIIERVKEAARFATYTVAAANFLNECSEAYALFDELKRMADDFNSAKKIVKGKNKARGDACNGFAMDTFLDSL